MILRPPPLSLRSILLLALAVAALLRVLVNLAAPTQLHHPEEFVNLRLSAALLGGYPDEAGLLPEFPAAPPGSEASLAPSLFDYQYQDWDGGTLVVAVVLVPIAAVLGLSVAAVKSGAMLWALAVIASWVLLFARLYGRRGAMLAAFCFVATPVPYLLQSCIHWGNHVESALFVPLGLLALILVMEASQPRRVLLWSVVLGLVFGFASWFSLLNLTPALLTLVALALLSGRQAPVRLFCFAVGFTAGFSPWFGRNDFGIFGDELVHGQSLVDVFSGVLSYGWGPADLWDLLTGYPRFFDWSIHGLWQVPEAVLWPLDRLTRITVLLCGLLALLDAARSSLAVDGSSGRLRFGVLLVISLSALAMPILLASQGEHSDRRLGPIYPLLWALLAAGVASSWLRPRLRWLLGGLVATVLVANISATMGLISSWDRPADRLRPWQHFALPAAEPRSRIEACVPHLAAHQVAPLNAALKTLYAGSRSGGLEELQGICRAFAGRGTFLQRPSADCPERGEIDIMELWLVDDLAEARALGRGLAIRCSQGLSELGGVCDEVNGAELREACRQGLTEN